MSTDFEEPEEERPIQVIPILARPIVQPDFCIGCKYLSIIDTIHDTQVDLGMCDLIETLAEWPAIVIDDVAKGCFERRMPSE